MGLISNNKASYSGVGNTSLDPLAKKYVCHNLNHSLVLPPSSMMRLDVTWAEAALTKKRTVPAMS